MVLIDKGFVEGITVCSRIGLVIVLFWIASKFVNYERPSSKSVLLFLTTGGALFSIDLFFLVPIRSQVAYIGNVVGSIIILPGLFLLLFTIGVVQYHHFLFTVGVSIAFPSRFSGSLGRLTFPVGDHIYNMVTITIVVNFMIILCLTIGTIIIWNAVNREWTTEMWKGIPMDPLKSLQIPAAIALYNLSCKYKQVPTTVIKEYIEWREATLQELRNDPTGFSHPTTVHTRKHGVKPDGKGNQDADTNKTDTPTTELERTPIAEWFESFNASRLTDYLPVLATENGTGKPKQQKTEQDIDRWGVERFLEETDNYPTLKPHDLRCGLELITYENVVWVSPKDPILIALCCSLAITITYGNLLILL